jgi:hypothetical protein
MEVNGTISENPFDALSVKFLNYNISNIDYVTNMKGFDLDGIISGNIVLSDIYLVPTFYADVSINDFGFNGDRLGNAIIRSKWDNKKKGISIDARVIYTGNAGMGMPLVVNGYYYPSSETQNFDLSINVDNFRLRTIAPYLSSFATLVNGTASGSVMLEGTNKMPLISGYVKLMRTVLKINFLNTTYAFAYDSIKISNSEFVIRDLILFDQPNNDTAIMNARIYHNNFHNLSFDITIEPRKLMCLNTGPAQNESFYGKAYASGIAHIYGSADNIKMDITASSENGTEIFIPIGGLSSAGPSDYITFVNKEAPADETEEDKGKNVSGVSLDMSLDVTPDAEIQLMLDPRTADRLKCKGNGDIRITISAGGIMKIYGDYNITTGDYLFTFQNIINKHFNIQEGSSVKWNGDPYNGELDISAVYKLKANLAGLGVDTVRQLVPVECIINITEKLSNPEFSFDVRLPSLNDFEKAAYLTAINQDMNNNFISLLIINSFVRSSVASGNNYSAANASLLGRSASEVLSNQLSNWLSQISQNVDIGINYRPGDNITQEEVEVALSTQLFNDRVTIESNLGVSTGQGGTANINANQIVGDVNVDVKLTKSLKLNVFNRSNQYDALQNIAPYTQGIGISYRKEFNTLKDLFKKRDRKAARLNKAKSKE